MATIKNVNYRPVRQHEKADWGKYENLVENWEGLTVDQAKDWVKKMRENPDFSCFVLDPGHKTVFINYKGFALFVMWWSRNRYKAKKETLRELLDKIQAERALLKEVAGLDFDDMVA